MPITVGYPIVDIELYRYIVKWQLRIKGRVDEVLINCAQQNQVNHTTINSSFHTVLLHVQCALLQTSTNCKFYIPASLPVVFCPFPKVFVYGYIACVLIFMLLRVLLRMFIGFVKNVIVVIQNQAKVGNRARCGGWVVCIARKILYLYVSTYIIPMVRGDCVCTPAHCLGVLPHQSAC